MHIMRTMHENNSRTSQPQVSQTATALEARVAAMRAGGMSATAIRRALGLSQTAALASGVLALAQATGRAEARSESGGAELRRSWDIIEVRDAAARACGLCPETLSGHDRRQPAVRARHLAIHLMRELCPGVSLMAIGHLLDRDHTTVHYGRRRADALLRRDAGFRALHARARGELGLGAIKSGPKKGEKRG